MIHNVDFTLPTEQLGRTITDLVVVVEGGYVNNPNDRGGKTRWGVTEAQARASGYKGAMKDLPRERALEILVSNYWVKMGAFRLAEAGFNRLAYAVMDWSVNSGRSAPAKALQEALNALNLMGERWKDIAEDGAIGPGTIAALQACAKSLPDGEQLALQLVNAERTCFLKRLARKDPKQETFMVGWVRRVDSVDDTTDTDRKTN